MYFRLQSIPELRHLSLNQRKRVARAFRRELKPQRRRTVNILTGLLWWLPILPIIALLMYSSACMLMSGIVLLSVFVMFAFRINRSTRHAVARYLDDIHHNGRLKRCLECDYYLKGTTSETCPECGAEVVLHELCAENVLNRE